MVSFRVVADSTADFPERYSVPIVPVHVYAGIVDLKDKVDFTVETLQDLVRKGIKRRTAAPSVKDWMRAFESLGNELPIVAFTISSKLSSSYRSAEIAARMLKPKGYEVHVVDSKSGGIGIGILVRDAVEMAKEGVPVTDAVDRIRKEVDSVRVYLVITDMAAAAESGRIPSIVGKIGKFLDLHPVFHVVDGEIKLWKTFRGIDHVLATFKDMTASADEVWVGSVGESPPAREICKHLARVGVKTECVPTDPAIGAHFGVGAFGIAFLER